MVWELFLVWCSSYCMPATTGRLNGTEEHVRQNSFMHKHLTLLFLVQFFGALFTTVLYFFWIRDSENSPTYKYRRGQAIVSEMKTNTATNFFIFNMYTIRFVKFNPNHKIDFLRFIYIYTIIYMKYNIDRKIENIQIAFHQPNALAENTYQIAIAVRFKLI